ncbi:MAG TPA: hypothetical protein VN754_13590 [Candidatus Binataceae bacterium]|nr:hypothetical protein [Candidatus Binataceae bacterium]
MSLVTVDPGICQVDEGPLWTEPEPLLIRHIVQSHDDWIHRLIAVLGRGGVLVDLTWKTDQPPLSGSAGIAPTRKPTAA